MADVGQLHTAEDKLIEGRLFRKALVFCLLCLQFLKLQAHSGYLIHLLTEEINEPECFKCFFHEPRSAVSLCVPQKAGKPVWIPEET